MKLKALGLLIAIAILSFTVDTNNQEKEYPVKMTLNEWNTLLISVNSPDDVTVNQKKSVLSKLVNQINVQIKTEDSLFKIKATQDSLKNKKN